MVFVGAFGLDIQIGFSSIGKGFEEMMEHFRGHIAYFFPFEFCLPDQPVATAEINGDLGQAIVHRKAKAVALDTQLIGQRFMKDFAQGNRRVLDSVVLVYF